MRLNCQSSFVVLLIILAAHSSWQQPNMKRKRAEFQEEQLSQETDWSRDATDSQRFVECQTTTCETSRMPVSTSCVTSPLPTSAPASPPPPGSPSSEDDSEQRGRELRNLVQHLYVAQARVQLEATEIHKAQAVASSAQAQLEESANHVRTITATLHNAQQEVAAAAIRAQIAQLQLAAHDQLLFAARQDVDSLSSQVVGLQAAEGIVPPKLTVDLHALLEKLRQPLQHYERPTAVPLIVPLPPHLSQMTPPPPPPPQSLEVKPLSDERTSGEEQS